MIDVKMTNREAFELYDLLRFACQFGKAQRGSPLDNLRLKLRERADEIVCPRCGEKPITRKGFCAACAMAVRREKKVS